MAKNWFKPKLYGYGVVPASWEGWAATIGFILLVLADLQLTRVFIADRRTAQAVTWSVFALLVVGFIVLCIVKSSHPWRWRWGGKD